MISAFVGSLTVLMVVVVAFDIVIVAESSCNKRLECQRAVILPLTLLIEVGAKRLRCTRPEKVNKSHKIFSF